MDKFLEFAKGPLFVFTFLFMVFGLLRQIILQILNMKSVLKRLNQQDFPFVKNIKLFIEWMLPVGHIYRNNPFLSISSFIFHIGILIVPLFLLNHIDLWKNGTGISWPGISMWIADVLTIATILSCIILFTFRLLNKSTRALSDGTDYVLLICVGIPFLTGFMAMNPSFNPVSYNLIMLLHILSAELVFVMLPHSKLVHSVLFPFDRISSDIFWQMPEGAGDKIATELHGSEVKV